jgi:cerevisin
MPRWVGGFLPSPRLVHAITAPIEYKPLSPAVLKKALIKLSSKGLLTEIPSDTVNLLIFNNYTSYLDSVFGSCNPSFCDVFCMYCV